MTVTQHWTEVKAKIETELDAIMWDEPDDVKMSRLGVFPGGPGTRNQYLANLFFQVADTQAMSWWTAEPAMWQALADPDLSVDACKRFWKYMTVHMAHLMGDVDPPKCPAPWLNLPTLAALCDDVVQALDSIETKEQLRDLLWSWFTYMRRLNGWFFLVFPWEGGTGFTLQTEAGTRALVDEGELPASVLTAGNWKNTGA
jgi:Cucumopine synthase C-terminal helical bundle domain